MWLFVALILVPLIEIALFIEIGGWLTLWPTLGIVVGTAILGSWLMRQQGHRALADVQRALDRARDPLEPLAHGALILFSGALLLTPGFLTDALGLALLVPLVRVMLLRWILQRGVHRVIIGGGPHRPGGTRHPDDDVIDADFKDVTPGDEPPRRDGDQERGGRKAAIGENRRPGRH